MAMHANECLLIKKYFYYIQFGFFLIFITPVLEELIYRGIAYSVYRKKYDSKWAIIISSLLFGLGHTGGVGLPIIIGIVCGMIYERKESLPMAICAHGLINAGGFIYMILFNQFNMLFT
jgi:membrane protease YdiL (CAAX protease family)